MSLARLLRALKHFMPAQSRWALLTEDASLLYHTPTLVTDRQDFQKVLRELIPYLEILSGDILLVQGAPLLSHEGEAALVMIFPKSVTGQNLFFVERLTFNPFGSSGGKSVPPLYLSRNFADEGDMLGELQDILPEEGLEVLTASFHHLLWTQLKVLDLFAGGTLKKIGSSEVRKFFETHVQSLSPYFEQMLDQVLVYERTWAPGRSVHIQVEKKKKVLSLDFSKTQWPKEWSVDPDQLKDLIPQVLRQHLYPDLPGTEAEHEFLRLTLPSESDRASKSSKDLWTVVTAPLLCDLLSDALGPFFYESQGASSSTGPLHFKLDFEKGPSFQHLLFGGGGASAFSHGEFQYNRWLPGLESFSFQRSLSPLPLEVIKLGRHKNSGGQGLSLGGDGVEWVFKLKAPATLNVYTFQALWPAKGLKSQNSGKKAQVLIGSGEDSEDILGKRIQLTRELPTGTVLTLRTSGGAGLVPGTSPG